MTSSPARPRATFDCLWCGRSWTTRTPDDLEGWAQLCPDCLGKAGENSFLRFRLRDAIVARGAAGSASAPAPEGLGAGPPTTSAPPPAAPSAADPMVAYYEARAGDYHDRYLRLRRSE